MMDKAQWRMFFVTSSIPESENDWKSVFIGDMLKAFSSKQLDILYWGPNGVIPDSIINTALPSDIPWLVKMSESGGIANILRGNSIFKKGLYSFRLLYGIRNSATEYKQEFDCYFVNWLQNCLSIPSDNKPLFVTALGSDMQLLDYKLVRYLLRRKFKKHPTTLLPNAKWMVEKLEAYFGDIAKIQFAPLGIREDWFENTDRFPTEWISVSRITASKVKQLFSWGGYFFSKNLKLMLVGPKQENISIPNWVESTGPVTMEQLKEQWYPKTKALIFLSDHSEGRPQTIIEAMASGVPVICTDKPLYREFIETGVNGYLVSDKKELKMALEKLSDPQHNLEVSNNSKKSIFEQIGTWDTYVEKIMRLFD